MTYAVRRTRATLRPGGRWCVNVPSRMATRRGWLVLGEGEPPCPLQERDIHPTRAAARATVCRIMQARKRSGLGMGMRPRIVRCTLLLAWAKP